MLRIHLKTSLRRIFKEPVYNLINITAFTLSMSIACLLAIVIYNQYNFDLHNTNKDQIYRVNTKVNFSVEGYDNYATSPAFLKDLIDTTFFKESVSLVPLQVKITANTNESISGIDPITANGYAVEGDYFSLFQIPLIEGDVKTVFSDKSKVAISTALAKKLFIDEHIIGKEIRTQYDDVFIISGVFDLAKNKTHLSNDILFSSLNNQSYTGQSDSSLYAYDNYNSSYLYVQSKIENSSGKIKDVFASLNKTYNSYLIQNNSKFTFDFFEQPLTDISPRGKLIWNDNGQAMSKPEVYLFLIIIFVLISLTVINYSSVMTSLGLARSKETGIR